MTTMTTTDVRDVLTAIAEHDGRQITDLAVEAWSWQARTGNWTRAHALAAVAEYYRQAPQPTWPETGEPRPVMPIDIHQKAAVR